MKKFTIVNLLIAFAFILGACGTSNNVVNNHLISKRKYTKGFHVNKKSNFKNSDNKQEEEVLAFDAVPEDKKEVNVKTATASHDKKVEANVSKSINVLQEEATNAIDKKQTNSKSTTINQNSASENANERANEKAASKPSKLKLPQRKQLVPEAKESESSGSGWADGIFILAVICAILIPPLGVGIYTNIDWMKVLICLLLTFLFFLPGMIYALLVVFDVI